MFTAVFLLLLVSASDSKVNEAEKLFRTLESKVANAEAVKIVSEMDTKGGTSEADFKLTLFVAKGNKARFKLNASFPTRESSDFSLTSNGKQMRIAISPNREETRATPEDLQSLMTKGGTRIGFTVVAMMAPSRKDNAAVIKDLEKELPLSDFRIGAQEKVDNRETHVIHYRLGPREKYMEVTLWLDASTLLPVKRQIDAKAGTVRSVEVFREFTINPKLPTSEFDLPK